MHRRLLSVLVATPILVLSACGGGDAGGDLDIPQSKATASAKPTATQSPRPATTAEAAKLQVSVLGSSVAKTAEEKAVVDAWMVYWQAATDTYADLEPSPKLDIARDTALSQVLDYLNELKTKKQRSVGWVRDHVTKIAIVGDAATIGDCAENFSFAVDADDNPVEQPAPYYDIVGSLSKEDGKWLVTRAKTTPKDNDCRK